MADPIKGFWWTVLHVSGPGGGFSEKFAMKDRSSNPDQAIQAARELCEKRGQALSTDASIIWARVSREGAEKEAFMVLDNPVDGGLFPRPNQLPAAHDGPLNEIGAAMHIRFESGEGKWSNRLVRAVRDDLINAGKAAWTAFTPLALGAEYVNPISQIGEPPVATWNYMLAMRNYFQAIRKLTCIARPNFVVVNKQRKIDGYFLYDIVKYAFRKISRHKTGRPFGQSPGRAKAQV